MSGVQKWPSMQRRSQRGNVLLEYVILLTFILLSLVGVQTMFDPTGGTQVVPALFNPSGDYANNFGTFGNAFHSFYTNLVTGISLPIP